MFYKLLKVEANLYTFYNPKDLDPKALDKANMAKLFIMIKIYILFIILIVYYYYNYFRRINI